MVILGFRVIFPVPESAMRKKFVTHWTIEESNEIVARKLEAAKKYQPRPKRQNYQSLPETKKMNLRVACSLRRKAFQFSRGSGNDG